MSGSRQDANGRGDGAAIGFEFVVLVASFGGLEAISTVAAGLPDDFPVPVLVVQHRRGIAGSVDPMVTLIGRRTGLPVRSACEGGDAYRAGVTVVPGGVSASIDEGGRFRFDQQIPGPPHHGDALLASVAVTAPTIAVILTGRLDDGARGCRIVKRHGGRVLVQDPQRAAAGSMPSHAIATGCADFVLPLDRIATALSALAVAPGGAELFAVALPPWAQLGA